MTSGASVVGRPKSARWRRRPRFSLRVRITALSLGFLTVALAVGGSILMGYLDRELVSQIDGQLSSTAGFVERSLSNGSGLPQGSGPSDLYIQFFSAGGARLGASSNAASIRSLIDGPPPTTGVPRFLDETNPRLGLIRVLISPLEPARRSGVTLAVAMPESGIVAVRTSQAHLLLLVLVVGYVMLATLVWAVVGRALKPVDEMAKAAFNVSEGDLNRRIALPGTGDELDRLATTLNEMLARVQAAVERERRFVADANHELRTPIAAARALLETALADPQSFARSRSDAVARLDHLQQMVEDLLVLARHDQGGPNGAPSGVVDLDELVLLQAHQLEGTTQLTIDTARVSGGQVPGRDTEWARVVENLASNAVRFATSTVRFSVRQSDGSVEMVVSDDGPGVPEEERERIFERFATSPIPETGANRGANDGEGLRSGVGLGLAIARAIVSSHGGTITVERSTAESAEPALAGNGRAADHVGARFVVSCPAAS